MNDNVIRYKRILETYNLPANPQILKRTYKILCTLENVKPTKNIAFHLDISLTEYRRFLFIFKKYKIRIKSTPNWLIELFHEFAHQALPKVDDNIYHGKLFNEYFDEILDLYFEKFVKEIFKMNYKNEN